MKTLIISYSMTGNNDALATSLAAALHAEHVRVTEHKHRSMGTIAMDVMLKRTPRITMPTLSVKSHDLVLFVAPVWMGVVATPLRACFKQLAPELGRYGFITISGGADGPNPKLKAELTERLGKEPALLHDLHVADLLPCEPKPTRDDTSKYHVTADDVHKLTETIVAQLAASTGQPS